MLQVAFRMASAFDPAATTLDLRAVEAPLALCSVQGELRDTSPRARELLARLCDVRSIPAQLPGELFAAVARAAEGELVEWRPPSRRRSRLLCARYRQGSAWLLVLGERSVAPDEGRTRRAQAQRLEVTEGLIASIAHELRSAVASIVYSTDFLAVSGATLSSEALRETTDEIVMASLRIRGTVDGLLDYARLGPSFAAPVSLRDILTRSQELLRASYGQGSNTLEIQIPPEADWVLGNALIVEQVFVAVLLAAGRGADRPVRVVVAAQRAPRPGADASAPLAVRVRICDDGPGLSEEVRASIRGSSVTASDPGVGVGLTSAREAAESLGGALVLEAVDGSLCLTLYLPLATAPGGS